MYNLKVSACIITYNHEPFIRECLEGAINQKVNFEYEIVIGEDFSSDKTKEICIEYVEKYPNLIKFLPREKKLGMNKNWIDTIQNCEGKYIAICEGDDYWSDSSKLQKQVDILESNINLVGCFHNSEERYWNDYSKTSSLYLSFPASREFSIQEITQYNMIPTASIIFTKPVADELNSEEFLNLPIVDWPLHLLNTRKGNYYYLSQVMSVRNLNPESVWGMQDQAKNISQVILVYNVLIDSGWFDDSIIDLFKRGCANLQHSVKPQKKINFKSKVIKKIIRILKKL